MQWFRNNTYRSNNVICIMHIYRLKNCAIKSLRTADLSRQSQVQAVYSAPPVLKVISHFAWNCAEYISRRAYEIEGKKRGKALWKKNTLKLSINHVEFREAWFIVSLILCKSFFILHHEREWSFKSLHIAIHPLYIINTYDWSKS